MNYSIHIKLLGIKIMTNKECFVMSCQVKIPWENKKLTGTVHYPEGENLNVNVYPLVIICHGFIGSRIGVDRLFVKTANELTKDPCIVLRFDYSGCGESEGIYGKTGLDELIDQTQSAIEFAAGLPQVDQSRIYLLGHSLGGATAVLTAAIDHRVHKLIIWSAVAKPFKDIANIVGIEKLPLIENSIPIDYLGYLFHKKYFDSLKKYNPIRELNSFSGDVLIIHGSGDEEIPVDYGEIYHDSFQRRKVGSSELKVIANANHTYSSSAHFDELISITRKWLSFQKTEQLVY